MKAWPQDPHEWQHGLSCKAPQSVNTMESRLFVVHEEFEELESLRGFWIRLLKSKDLIITIKISLFMLLQCHQIGCYSIKKKNFDPCTALYLQHKLPIGELWLVAT